MTCEDCLYYEVCPLGLVANGSTGTCLKFKDKANFVEVVRCKDCKHNVANWHHDELDATDYTDITCDYFMTDGMHPNDFCSYGEKRSEEE
jgi:hypothetical protein